MYAKQIYVKMLADANAVLKLSQMHFRMVHSHLLA